MNAFFKSGVIGFLKESYASLRWYFYYAWKMSVICLYNKGRETRKTYGVTLTRQCLSLLRLALIHNITPDKYYKYQFYLNENKEKELVYFYTFELPNFHIVSNAGNKTFKEATRFIGNKAEFTQALKMLNIPHVPIIQNLEDIENPDINLFFRTEDIFCKPNKGSQSKDAFKVKYHKNIDSYKILPINGKEIEGFEEAKAFLRKMLTHCRNLQIQPYIESHNGLKSPSQPEQSTTVRIITVRNGDIVTPIYMQIEIPDKRINERQFYKLYPLDLNTFEVSEKFKSTLHFNKDMGVFRPSSDIKEMLSNAMDVCIKAHKGLIKLKSVAFDLFITATGPLIIEANFNWDVEMLYRSLNSHEVSLSFASDTH